MMLNPQDMNMTLVMVLAALGGLNLIMSIGLMAVLVRTGRRPADEPTDDDGQIRYIISFDRADLSDEVVTELITDVEDFLESDDPFITVPTNVKVQEIYD